MTDRNTDTGVISFVGAGPGAADLITLRGAQRLADADVVIWAASLVPPEVMAHCRDDVIVHDSKSMNLDEICAVFAAHPDKLIVRLHTGDPTVYSAIGEQISWCTANGREFEIVPGVSSVSATAAEAGCELTIPGVSQSIVYTRLASRTKASMPDSETIEAYAATGATLAIFLSVSQVDALRDRLLAAGSGYTADTPVVIGHKVSWPDGETVRTTIGELPATVAEHGFVTATLFLVGPALAGATEQCSHVYSSAYTTRFREATSTS